MSNCRFRCLFIFGSWIIPASPLSACILSFNTNRRLVWLHPRLELMLKMKKKAEIQALSSFGFQYLTQEYLPRKIRDGDWI